MTDSAAPSRLARLRAAVAATGADAFLVSQPDNRAYFSGFSGSSGWLLVTADRAFIATDFRYYEQVGLQCPHFELFRVQTTFSDLLPEMIAAAGVRRLAFEADHATFADVQSWSRAAPEVEWVPMQGVGMGLRAIKEPAEVTALRAAIALTDEALAAALAQARPGMTELELAWLIESYMRTHGAQGVSFELIVACGPNGARPHARPGNDPLVAGVPVVIDIGARVNNYCADLTRTVCLGQPADPGRFWEVYNTVLQAQLAAEAAIRPGLTGAEVDAVARDVITAAGYGPNFGHGLGHGVGLVVHEEPRLSRTFTGTLAAGQVVTVEPGIYLPGWGGVRIEDIVLITENGAEVLSRAPKEPTLG